jgi:hypothetical protein
VKGIEERTRQFGRLLGEVNGNVPQALWAHHAGAEELTAGRMPWETARYIPLVLQSIQSVQYPSSKASLAGIQRGVGAYTSQQIQQMITQSALQYGVDPSLALAVAAHESNFNPTATHVNPNGTTDWGVMQLNDLTVQTFNVSNPLDPQQNINAGVQLLSQLSNKYSGNLTDILWAYNAGSGSVSSGVMPSGVQSYIDWVSNYMGVPADSTVTADGTTVDSSGTVADSSVVTIAGVDIPTTYVLAGGIGLLALVFFSMR